MNLNATILGQVISFVIFVLFCMKFVWPPLMAAIEKRQKDIASDLAFAERAKKDIDLAQANATKQLKKVKAEAQLVIEQANKHRAQILDEAKVKAEQERTKIIAQAQDAINTERQRVREELRKQVAILAIAGAEQIIERSLDEAANSDIVDNFIAEISKEGGRG